MKVDKCIKYCLITVIFLINNVKHYSTGDERGYVFTKIIQRSHSLGIENLKN